MPPSLQRGNQATEKAKGRRAIVVDPRLTEAAVGTTKARIANGTAIAGTWRDPDDRNANRREAAEVVGHRAVDGLMALCNMGSISRSHYAAGDRYRRTWEMGSVGLGGSSLGHLGSVRVGLTGGIGPSEVRSQYLERYQAAQKALGRLAEIIDDVVCAGVSLTAYARRAGIRSASTALGRLIAGLDVLRDHFETVDEPRKRRVDFGFGEPRNACRWRQYSPDRS